MPTLPIEAILISGITMFLLLVFQVLLGLRIIKFRGPKHWKIHRYNGLTILTLAVGHAAAALTLFGGQLFGG